ncbi:MAG: tRNA pseudouridine(55) synthase TruB [Bacilli bacterium]|nr:tRNA pseudouridine(55) synthase TruB [Bacilli bacterium]
MDGILLINKEKGLTSRDVVNKLMKNLNTKKIGHAGTLDPLATGLLVIGVGKGTKILDLLTLDTKEYIAVVKMGIQTDTMDITGKVLKTTNNIKLSKEKLNSVLKSYQKSYEQTVPKYSAVKINGKKLYQYARNNEKIELPKRLVKIFNIELLDYDCKNNEFTFKTLVSKGTYIRSLIDDIGNSLNINCTMKELVRVKSGKFNLQDSFNINENFKFIKIEDALDFPKIIIENDILLKKVKNGNQIKLDKFDEYLTLLDINNQVLAIYKKDENNLYKAFKVF